MVSHAFTFRLCNLSNAIKIQHKHTFSQTVVIIFRPVQWTIIWNVTENDKNRLVSEERDKNCPNIFIGMLMKPKIKRPVNVEKRIFGVEKPKKHRKSAILKLLDFHMNTREKLKTSKSKWHKKSSTKFKHRFDSATILPLRCYPGSEADRCRQTNWTMHSAYPFVAAARRKQASSARKYAKPINATLRTAFGTAHVNSTERSSPAHKPHQTQHRTTLGRSWLLIYLPTTLDNRRRRQGPRSLSPSDTARV